MPVLSDLLSDTSRGASLIYRDALTHFSTRPDNRLVSETIAGTQLLQGHFPTMGLFHHLWNIVSAIHETGRMRMTINALLNDITAHAKLLAKHGQFLLPNYAQVMTISYSGTVRDILIKATKTSIDLKIFCIRSAPMNEGKILAKSLQRRGISTQILEDNKWKSFLSDITHILVGADLLSDSFFINKTGTADLMHAAGEYQIPVRIITTTHRFVHGYSPASPRNPIFEVIPYTPSMKILTEKGLIRPSDLSRQ